MHIRSYRLWSFSVILGVVLLRLNNPVFCIVETHARAFDEGWNKVRSFNTVQDMKECLKNIAVCSNNRSIIILVLRINKVCEKCVNKRHVCWGNFSRKSGLVIALSVVPLEMSHKRMNRYGHSSKSGDGSRAFYINFMKGSFLRFSARSFD